MLGFPLKSFGELRLRLFFVMTELTLVHGARHTVFIEEHLKLYSCEEIIAIREDFAWSEAIFHSLNCNVTHNVSRTRRIIPIFRKTSTFPTNVNKILSLSAALYMHINATPIIIKRKALLWY